MKFVILNYYLYLLQEGCNILDIDQEFGLVYICKIIIFKILNNFFVLISILFRDGTVFFI